MSYTPPPGDAINFTWEGESAYTQPAGDEINFSWFDAGVTETAEGTLLLLGDADEVVSTGVIVETAEGIALLLGDAADTVGTGVVIENAEDIALLLGDATDAIGSVAGETAEGIQLLLGDAAENIALTETAEGIQFLLGDAADVVGSDAIETAEGIQLLLGGASDDISTAEIIDMTTASKYAHTDKLFSDGSVSWYDAFYLSLITDAYVFSNTHTAWAEVSPYEVAIGAGYTTGGKLLTGISVANNGLFAADVEWAALTKTFKQGVLRVNKTVGGTINPLIGCIIFHPAGDNIEADNELFAVRWPNGRVVRFGT